MPSGGGGSTPATSSCGPVPGGPGSRPPARSAIASTSRPSLYCPSASSSWSSTKLIGRPAIPTVWPVCAARSGAKGAGKPCVEFLDLESLLKGPDVPPAPLLVVFDNSLDEQGHKGAEQLPLVADELVRDLRRAIDRLHRSGVETIHVVTDHGFLL